MYCGIIPFLSAALAVGIVKETISLLRGLAGTVAVTVQY